jgi:hypothetical protein
MTGSTAITGNTAATGGGVYNESGTFTKGTGTVSGNTGGDCVGTGC